MTPAMSGPIQNVPSSAPAMSAAPSSAPTISAAGHTAPPRLVPRPKGAASPGLSPFRSLLDGRKAAAPLGAPSAPARPPGAEPTLRTLTLEKPRLGEVCEPGERAGARSRLSRDGEWTAELSPLEPFRVNAALLAPTAAPAAPRTDDVAFAVASELLESMRVGRFGRDGHVVSLRLRAGGGTVGVELREEHGELRLRLEGGSAAELERLGARVRGELEQRGLELSELELA